MSWNEYAHRALIFQSILRLSTTPIRGGIGRLELHSSLSGGRALVHTGPPQVREFLYLLQETRSSTMDRMRFNHHAP